MLKRKLCTYVFHFANSYIAELTKIGHDLWKIKCFNSAGPTVLNMSICNKNSSVRLKNHFQKNPDDSSHPKWTLKVRFWLLNVCLIKIRSKLSSVLILCLLRIFMKQTLCRLTIFFNQNSFLISDYLVLKWIHEWATKLTWAASESLDLISLPFQNMNLKLKLRNE